MGGKRKSRSITMSDYLSRGQKQTPMRVHTRSMGRVTTESEPQSIPNTHSHVQPRFQVNLGSNVDATQCYQYQQSNTSNGEQRANVESNVVASHCNQYQQPNTADGEQRENVGSNVFARQCNQYQHQNSYGGQPSSNTDQTTITGAASDQKRHRGHARQCDEWGTVKLRVQLNASGIIVGQDKKKVITMLGILVKNGQGVPLTYPTFNDIPEPIRDALWDDVQNNTTLPKEAKVIVMKKMCKTWKDFKSRLKAKYFEPYKDNEEHLLQCPDERVDPEQWKTLVTYWKDPEVEEIAERNRKNKANMKFPHRTGRIEFGDIVEEMKTAGVEPSRLDLFIRTRLPKTGVAIDEDTNTVIELMQTRLSQLPESERTSEFKEKLFCGIFGKDEHGHTRCAVKKGHTQEQDTPASSSFDVQTIPQDFIDKITEKIKEDMRAELRAEVATTLNNFITVNGGVQVDQLSSVEAVANRHVVDTSSIHQEHLSATRDDRVGSSSLDQ